MTAGFYYAAIAGTILSFLAGCLWYTLLTGKIWQQEMGFSDARIKEIFTPGRMFLAFVTEWIAAFCTIGLFHNLPVALTYKVLMILGVLIFQGIKLSIFDGKSFKTILINEGYRIISILILAATYSIFM
ncbi:MULTISPECIES: DUF1761 domain-containing protein [Enterococcus]|uniref:DUF1761 domain-containing protein n=1 Tax=Candidatus Enterococcus murrayae TaxID=2815321 RepID=A0ABS3HNY6_9ENTE|nr:DUF1761 domain-containing protein [Enterococcus sp. MJM16]MBO0454605.1 DUF1761 domain-containing protein [Enterococcus sp. MJM16]